MFFFYYEKFQSPHPPQFIYWQRFDRMVSYDDNRRDVTIETIPGPRTQSRLIIRVSSFIMIEAQCEMLKKIIPFIKKEPQISDSGNYTCRASNTEPASIFVYVSRGR